MQDFCEKVINCSNFGEEENQEQYIKRALYCSLSVLSILGLAVVALSIFYNKKLSEHPSPLIARICLVEAIMCWNSLMRFLEPKNFVCYM